MYRNAGGSTIVNLSSGYLDEPLGLQAIPTNHEQRCIAEILDTVDEAIRKTEQVITKLQQMKQGLLHDLLTRGIDENGELRDPERHPEQFKDSPLGRVPMAWTATCVGNVFHVGSGMAPGRFRSDHGKYQLVGANGPIARCTATNFGPGYIVGRVGAAGAVNMVRERVWASDNTLTVSPTSMLDFEFGFNLLRQTKPWELATKNAQPLVTQTNLAALEVAVPPMDEQLRLREVLASWDTREKKEVDERRKLRVLKQGLMDDLLTGRLRVPVPDERTP